MVCGRLGSSWVPNKLLSEDEAVVQTTQADVRPHVVAPVARKFQWQLHTHVKAQSCGRGSFPPLLGPETRSQHPLLPPWLSAWWHDRNVTHCITGALGCHSVMKFKHDFSPCPSHSVHSFNLHMQGPRPGRTQQEKHRLVFKFFLSDQIEQHCASCLTFLEYQATLVLPHFLVTAFLKGMRWRSWECSSVVSNQLAHLNLGSAWPQHPKTSKNKNKIKQNEMRALILVTF